MISFLNQERDLKDVQKILTRCSARGVERTSRGAQFICPVPKLAPHAFLHSLYGPCDSGQLEEVKALFGYVLPDEYLSFMRLHNGARLFAGAVSISGWNAALSRSVALEERQAILLDFIHREYRLLSSSDWCEGWRPIGGLVAENVHDLTINPSGTIRLRNTAGNERTWKSFNQMLTDCVTAADTCFDCDGIGDGGYVQLEEAFEALAAPIN